MAKTQYLTYYVHLDNQAAVDALNAQYPQGANIAPYNPVGPSGMAVQAAIAAGLYPPTVLPVLNVGDTFATNALTSEWFTTSSTFPKNVAVFTISSGWWIFGSSTKFFWIASFVYSPAPTGAPDPTGGTGSPGVPSTDDGNGTIDTHNPDSVAPAALPTRRFLDGFEILLDGEGSSGDPAGGLSRVGATTKEGMGFAYRNAAAGAMTRTHQYPSSPARSHAWNRFYVVARKLPNISTEIFRISSAAQSGSGARLQLAADGSLAMYVTDGLTTPTLVSVTSGQLIIGKRHRIDVVTYMGSDLQLSPAPMCECQYFLDGVRIGKSNHNPGGLVANVKIADVQLGNSPSVGSSLEIDFDDWRCCDVPDDKLIYVRPFGTNCYDATAGLGAVSVDALTSILDRSHASPNSVDFETFRCIQTIPNGVVKWPRNTHTGRMDCPDYWVKVTDSVDWLQGSRVVLLNDVGAASMGSFTGDYRMIGSPLTRVTNAGGVSSTVSADILQITTDALKRLATVPGAQGWGAINVGVLSWKTAAALDGSIGYKIGAAAAVYTTITGESTAGAWTSVLYEPAGIATTLLAPEAFAAVEAHYKKGADVNASHVRALLASVDVIGVFDDCDIPPGSGLTAPPAPRGLHNAPYPDTPWFRSPDRPLSPLNIKAGTYVGNGTGQDLLFAAPVHLLLIRPLSGDAGGARWFSAATNLQRANSQGAGFDFGIGYPRLDTSFTPGSPTDDQQQQYIFPIAGTDTQFNANAVTYQYIAVMDPGNRFLLSGCSYHENYTGVCPALEALEDPAFLALFGLFWRFDGSNTSTDELWIKGTGHAATEAEKSAAVAAVASAITFGLGSLTWDTGFVDTTNRYGAAFALMRVNDGSGDPNVSKVFAVGTYVGDGSASRTISFSPASGLRPLYAIVKPNNAIALHRDPSHTGTTSSSLTGTANASTGITAGAIDGFTVGSALNANGVIHSWFVILGSATAGNGGWSINGTFTPIATGGPATPHLVSDTATTTANTPVTIRVLDNDIGDGLSLDSIGTAPAHGTAVANADGTITYTPATDYVGTDTFTYHAKFTGQTATATATVTVTVAASGGGGGGGGGGTGGGGVPTAPDFDTTTTLPNTTAKCNIYTQRVANIALSRIGVSKQIADVVNENSQEALLVRLHFAECVERALRDFDWPKATKYAVLTLVTGSTDTPANKDWTYAYRAPTDMLKARRLVGDNGRKFDPAPIPWRLGTDANGDLIFTNQESTSDDVVTLEYTNRVACPSYVLDPEFRSALAWLLASVLAPPLSRDSAKQTLCLKAYLLELPVATTTAANEQQQELDEGDADWIRGR